MAAGNKFSGAEAQAALTRISTAFLEECRNWLITYEPDFFAEVGDQQVLDTCVQGLMAADHERMGGDAAPAARALSHAVGNLCLGSGPFEPTLAVFCDLVRQSAAELSGDLEPQGRG